MAEKPNVDFDKKETRAKPAGRCLCVDCHDTAPTHWDAEHSGCPLILAYSSGVRSEGQASSGGRISVRQ